MQSRYGVDMSADQIATAPPAVPTAVTSDATPLYVGVWTDRNDGDVRFVATAVSVEEAMAKVDAAWRALNDVSEDESPFDWKACEPRWDNPSVASAVDYDDYVQVLPLA